eukprot:COSAG02_NODE_5793_length_4032_cov_4.410120_2_plen_491_part_00
MAIPTHPKGPLSGAHNQPHEVPGLLATAYTGALALAAERDLRRVAFPPLGCGGGRHVYPPVAAARLAIKCCVLGALTANVSAIAFFLNNETTVVRAWIAAVEDELSAGTLAEVAPPAPEEDRAPGWRFRLAERRQREAEESAKAAKASKTLEQPPPEPEPEPEPDPLVASLGNVQNDRLFVESDEDGELAALDTVSDGDREKQKEDDDDNGEEAGDEAEDAQAFITASSLVSTIQPSLDATTASPPLSDADDSEGSVAFRAHLRTLADDPIQVELALMERRYFDSWRVLRTSPDLSVSFLFIPSDPDFLPRFRERMQAILPGSAGRRQQEHIGLSLEVTLTQEYPATAARVAVSTPIPATYRDAIASLAQDFLTSSNLQLLEAGQKQEQRQQCCRPSLRAMVRHLDRHISTAWEEAEEESGTPKVKVTWVDAPLEDRNGGSVPVCPHSQNSTDIGYSSDEEDVELWDPARHAAFQVRNPIEMRTADLYMY